MLGGSGGSRRRRCQEQAAAGTGAGETLRGHAAVGKGQVEADVSSAGDERGRLRRHWPLACHTSPTRAVSTTGFARSSSSPLPPTSPAHSDKTHQDPETFFSSTSALGRPDTVSSRLFLSSGSHRGGRRENHDDTEP